MRQADERDNRQKPEEIDRIRPMLQTDLPQVLAIEEEAFSIPWSNMSFQDALKREEMCFLVLEAAGEILGYVGAIFASGQGDVTNIAVRRQDKRHGYGRKLLEALLKEAKEAGIREMFLEVRESNAPARRLYEAAGFVPVGRRKQYYMAPKEDALIMKRQEMADVQHNL